MPGHPDHPEYLSRLIAKPWNLDRIRARTIIRAMAGALLRNERPAQDVLGGSQLPKMQIVGDVALIPITGIIDLEVPEFVKELGFNVTDANDIEEEIEQAIADPSVRFIVFDTDSPGGSALAGEKLFDVVESANKKKFCGGFCGDGCMMASTAYLAVAGCTAIYCGPYAEAIGCIGSYLALLDDTGYWAQMGIKFEVFRSGELKGICEDEISAAQKTYLQEMVNECGSLFRQCVLKGHPRIAVADMEGQWFKGSAAAAHGFVTGNVKDLPAAIAKFRSLIA